MNPEVQRDRSAGEEPRATSEPPPVGDLGEVEGLPASRFRPVAFISRYLEAHDLDHEVDRMPPRRPAGEVSIARAVLLRAPGGWRMAVVPAERRLDLGKARRALDEIALRPADDEEIRVLFPEFAPGALPPVGPHYPAPELLDWRLLQYERIACAGGDGEHAVLLDPRDLVDRARSAVADLCED